jgi:hypothetical protein
MTYVRDDKEACMMLATQQTRDVSRVPVNKLASRCHTAAAALVHENTASRSMETTAAESPGV